MRKITCIIVDDNPASIQMLLDYTDVTEQVIVVKTFTDPLEALAFLRKNHVDFVLLDIEMEPVDGLQFIVQMPTEIKVVICSAHPEFAIQGFTYNVCDFLLKPFDYSRFILAINRVNFDLGIAPPGKEKPDGNSYYFFFIRGGIRDRRMMVRFEELMYVETLNDLTYFHLIGREDPLQSRDTLLKIKQVLPTDRFFSISRSILINTDFMERYERRLVKLRGKKEGLRVGEKRNHPDFFDWLAKHSLDRTD